MSNKFASQLEQIRILSNKKKVVDDKVAELSAVMDYWQPFIRNISEIKVDDVVISGFERNDKHKEAKKRVVDTLNEIFFNINKNIRDLRRTDNVINLKAATKLHRMVNNFTGATKQDKKQLIEPKFIPPQTTGKRVSDIYAQRLYESKSSTGAVYRVEGIQSIFDNITFYDESIKHKGMNSVVEFMYKIFPETNIRDIDNVLKQNQTLSDKYYNEMLVQQNQIIMQGGTFNLDTPPNVGDAGTAPQNEKATTSKTKITPLQKGMIALSVLLLVSGVTIALLKSD